MNQGTVFTALQSNQRNISVNMFLVLVLSALFVLASAADESKENSYVGHLSNAITHESKIGAKELAAFWDRNEKTDQESIEEFLKVLEMKVLVQVKLDVAGLVRNSLGKAVTKPESTDMYQVLEKIIKRYTKELTLGGSRAITSNEKMKGSGPSQDGNDHLSKSIADLYDGIANKNVTEEEKTKLINKSQAQIDAFIKQSMNSEKKSNLKVATRSGSFFYKQRLQQQQQESSSSVAHKLASQMTTNMCAPPQPTYISNCNQPCAPYCTNCPGQSNHYDGSLGHYNSYNHVSGSSSSSNGRSEHTLINGLSTGLHNSYSHVNGLNYGGVGIGHSSNGLMESLNSGHHSSYNNAGGVGSNSLIGSGLTGGNYISGKSYSGSSHNSHVNSFDTSMSGSSGSYNGHQDLSGTYSGIANLWSPKKANGLSSVVSGSTYGGSNFVGNSNNLYSGTSLLGDSSYNHRSGGASNLHGYGGLGNMHGHGLGNAGGHYKSEHYSASNSQSSKSDSSASHTSYGKLGNIW